MTSNKERSVRQSLKSIRLYLNMSQTDLGKEIGVSRSKIETMERGVSEWTTPQMSRFAQLLNLDLPAFLVLVSNLCRHRCDKDNRLQGLIESINHREKEITELKNGPKS